jgi:hypothetical protein
MGFCTPNLLARRHRGLYDCNEDAHLNHQNYR